MVWELETEYQSTAQSDQSLRCPPEEALSPLLPMERIAKTLIRLGGCSGSSESSLTIYWKKIIQIAWI